MMGFKERTFAPKVSVSLEELVPQDHFYRHLQQVLDLSFVHDLVRECYAPVGRPSIDPIVFFKLQLVMFFEDIRSERLLMKQCTDYLGHPFQNWHVETEGEPLPLLAHTGRLVYNETSSPASSWSNDNTLM
jgi:hypothetical protein